MAFRRGFKSQCERRSVEIRKDLGLRPFEPLSAFSLSRHIGVTVWATSEIEGLTEADLRNLTSDDQDSWSAMTIRMQSKHLIVYRDVPSAPRINSVVMHEISHITLGHEMAEACLLEDGSLVPRNFDQEQEDEADWLAGTLLLPRPALLRVRSSGMTTEKALSQYGVSNEMYQWRIRMTGVDYQLGRK